MCVEVRVDCVLRAPAAGGGAEAPVIEGLSSKAVMVSLYPDLGAMKWDQDSELDYVFIIGERDVLETLTA